MANSDRNPIPAPSCDIEVRIYGDSGTLAARVFNPRSVLVRSPFRQMTAKAWIELHREDLDVPLDFGRQIEVFINRILVFRGQVSHIRLDSVEAPLTILAKREPPRLFPHSVTAVYENQSITDILIDILSRTPVPHLGYSVETESPRIIDRLGFVNTGLFDVISLLAILDHNALWDISWDSVLRYRSRTVAPNHRVRFDPDLMTLNLWRTDDDIKNAFVLHGGVTPPSGAEFRTTFTSPDSIRTFGLRTKHLYIRAITSEADAELLKNAILPLVTQPATQRALDMAGFFYARAGDAVRFDHPPFPVVDSLCRQVVEMVEYDYRHGRVITRLHFQAGARLPLFKQAAMQLAVAEESTPPVGPFQLDRSGLDSAAPLDTNL
ncbi:MAG TPA: hypothetical protein PLQ35_17185 [bacterium]|nr:hypothetical protein [bacterium]HQL64013.1 hypothetical protein [bacterium]